MKADPAGETGYDDSGLPGTGADGGVLAPRAPAPGGLDDLLAGMRGGDRAAAAEFLTRWGPRIRRRVRGKLSPAMRRIFDSQDILSTLGRRLDQFVRAGRVAAATEDELWALVFRMAERAVIDKARVFRRLRRGDGEDGDVAGRLARRLRDAARPLETGLDDEIGRAMRLLADRTDRQILGLRLGGAGYGDIARQVKLAPAAVRKRWQRIRSALQARYAAEAVR